MGAGDVQGLPLFAQLAPRQSYASMAGKPASMAGRDGGRTNDLKAKRREWPPGKRCTEHMEVMQARLTALEPNH